MQLSNSTPARLKLFGAFLLALTLTACGGSDSENSRFNDVINGATPPSETDSETETDSDVDIDDGDSSGEIDGGPSQLGRGSGDDFVAGEVSIGIGDNALSPGGRTSLSVTLVNHEGELVASPVSISFSSSCIADGSALLTGTSEEGGNTVETSFGQASVTYSANGCVGEDRITARATHEGVIAGSAWGTVTVESDRIQNLVFIDAEPEIINIKQAGGLETSRVTFQVLGATGSPMRDVEVNFSLNQTLGGLALVHTSDTSDAEGFVSTIVQAGNVPTAVWVTARTEEVATQSNRLAVTTGIPDQNSMSLSGDYLPTSWNYDNIESEINIMLADAFNNPPPDGTTVYFTTSGGAIEPECKTVNGICSVTWRSQNPRPGSGSAQLFSFPPIRDHSDRIIGYSTERQCPDGMIECRPGRVVVLATALGNESFIDETGTGLYDGPPDIFSTGGNCNPNVPASSASVLHDNDTDIASLACDDLGEAYLDKNFNGVRDPGEEYVDLNGDNQHTGPNGIFNGVLCSDAALDAGYCTREPVTIREQHTIIMVCDTPYTIPYTNPDVTDNKIRTILPGMRDVYLVRGEQKILDILLADCNGNGLPAGTNLSADEDLVDDADIKIIPDGDLVGSTEPSVVQVFITDGDDEDDRARGTLFLTLEVPTPHGGSLTSYYSLRINPPGEEEEEEEEE
ncbi:hypothetical protein [Marinimicrobium sp. ABcell2]|uniref:hypothetical protein n=1 Tax=Marinimicrobium sp. ABcell2 TaxID=3069751 RepID=UPI0027B08D84|nr:hypothetical protein [Marinimicrobium sp. ABcell2]MDQ2076508.1 hypothetical protein [Marinimicrobium sp. ABcell2]